MRKTLLMFLSFFALASVAVFFSPKAANAFPGFARKYNFPCSFCHIQWPRLADTGHFFKDRGFMLSTTGKANSLDMMFQDPKNQNYFPIGFHMSMAYYGSAVNGVENTGGNKNNGGWADGPGSNTIWDIESGGLINPWISFWVQPGGGGSPGPALGIVKLWVRFDDLLNSTWLNIYVGKTSLDPPVSNQRAMAIGTGTPFTMYDFQPGTPEVMNNGGTSTFSFLGGGLYYDGDSMEFLNDQTSIRYFGYHINSGAACATQSAWSWDPCETRVNINFIPQQSLYGQTGFNAQPGYNGGPATTVSGVGAPSGYQNNGFAYMAHVTQSFGGWGRTNGERIGVFALMGEGSALPGSGSGANSPGAAFYSREGVDLMINPIPNGGLNIDGAWEIVNDPTGMINASSFLPAGSTTTSGLEYMTWWLSVNWQPTFGGFFSQSGTNSNLFELIYNQLNMMQQPTFSGVAALPGNYDNVLAFTLLDRYWLWGSDRADISLFAQYQYMINYGVSGALNGLATASGDFHASNFGNGYFGNVEANNFSVGIDFAY
ncbi:cytochrome [Leptospirillum ferriphilum]|uniref:cytochrome n=1 Tax=Leptospirillum ferriphilum TaxID=178606 RepID=UPI000AE75A34|nr:cytochrome [Leptospirillum ferriphilum]